MKTFSEQALIGAKSFIEARPIETVLTEEFFKEVYSYNKLTAPTLDIHNIKVTPGEQVMTHNDAPLGMSYTPGKKMEYVSFGIPIVGNKTIFEEKFKQSLLNIRGGFRVVNNVFYLREFSETPLIGNDRAIEIVKDLAKQKVNNIIATLDELKHEFDLFNQDVLTPEIKKIAKERVDKENQKNETIEKLKLF